jgi:hypothetical protein
MFMSPLRRGVRLEWEVFVECGEGTDGGEKLSKEATLVRRSESDYCHMIWSNLKIDVFVQMYSPACLYVSNWEPQPSRSFSHV